MRRVALLIPLLVLATSPALGVPVTFENVFTDGDTIDGRVISNARVSDVVRSALVDALVVHSRQRG